MTCIPTFKKYIYIYVKKYIDTMASTEVASTGAGHYTLCSQCRSGSDLATGLDHVLHERLPAPRRAEENGRPNTPLNLWRQLWMARYVSHCHIVSQLNRSSIATANSEFAILYCSWPDTRLGIQELDVSRCPSLNARVCDAKIHARSLRECGR